MYSKIDNIKSTSYNNANKVVDIFFDSVTSRYQSNLEKSMEGNKFIFDSVKKTY